MNGQYQSGLYWMNLPNLEDNLGFLSISQLRIHFLKHNKTPSFIYTGTNFIDELKNLDISDDLVHLANNEGISFYFYEPLCFKLKDQDNHNRYFYSEFVGDENKLDIRSDELDSLEIFRNKFNIDKINVFTCEYNIQLINSQYPNLNLNCFDIFLRSLNHLPKFNLVKHNISKKFWCSNWRYATHRHITMSYLANITGNYSWHIKCEFNKLRENVWFNIDQYEQSDPFRFIKLLEGSYILENQELRIDSGADSVVVDNFNSVYIPGNTGPDISEKFINSYGESFCAVVNETRFAQPFANISEKTLNPLRARLPIILVAPPNSLKYLKTFGFKTFDRWWDESYDQEENHEKRMIKILELIDFIDNKSIDELSVIYQDMKEVLDHNHNITKWFKINTNINVL